MSYIPDLPLGSKPPVPPESTSKPFPSFEEYLAIMEKHPPPPGCKLLYCVEYKSPKGQSSFGANITAGMLAQRPFETWEEWYSSTANHVSNSTKLSPFISATTDINMAMKWIHQKRHEKDICLCAFDPTKSKPGSMIKMNWALEALRGSRWDEHDVQVLVWQTILVKAVVAYSSLENLLGGRIMVWLVEWMEFNVLFPEMKPGPITRKDEYEARCETCRRLNTDLSFKDWWIAKLSKFLDSSGSEPDICQIIERFRCQVLGNNLSKKYLEKSE